MPLPTVCPDVHAYQQLALGRLDAAEFETLVRHLESCAACARKIQSLAAEDTLAEWIRQAGASPIPAPDPHLSPLIQRLIQLRQLPTADNSAAAHPLTFRCGGCGQPLPVKVESAGKKVKCPHCGQVGLVPDVPAPRAAQPAPLETMETVEQSLPQPGAAATDTHAERTSGLAGGKEQKLCSFLAPAQAADELGRLGPYRVLKVLGAGGMGVVFHAEDPQLQRPVALKAMLPDLAENESARQRFLREARAAAKLHHDHVVTIHQVGEDRGAPFLAMEFLEGESLEDRLKRAGKLPLAEVVRIGREIAEGLAAAHERGLIHRDIKPANVWLEGKRQRVKILDFGLARAAGDEAHLTQSGAIVGTPAYMPPEQARGAAVDARSDLYSLGCVLYRLCTGKLPFTGDNTMNLLLALATEQPKPVRDLNPDVPPALASLIHRLLAKDPAERPATAEEVTAVLGGIDTSKPAGAVAGHALAENWRVDHNSYPRQLRQGELQLLKRNIFPQAPSDVLAEPKFLSLDPAHADYLRIAADSPLAKGGAGGAWPSYIGALPPGPAAKEGDWFTRLRQKWLQDRPAAGK